MPTTFTHDLFGREVYRMLPQEEREKIRRHGRLYRIGLHGPDILFYFHLYKNRVNQHGGKHAPGDCETFPGKRTAPCT